MRHVGPWISSRGSPMISPDHMILRVRNQAESIGFYQQILTFKHEGRANPFDILRGRPPAEPRP